MSSLYSLWYRLFPFKRPPPIDRFHVNVVTSSAELEFGEFLPLELRYVLAVRPMRHETFRQLLDKGFGIGVRTVDKTPLRVLQAVDRISQFSQHNTILPWLDRLLRHAERPMFSEEERRMTNARGIRLEEEIDIVFANRYEFKRIVLVALENQILTEREQQLVQEVNEDLYPYAIDVVINRITFDTGHTRTEVAQSIVKALVIVGPIAHALEHVLSGIGKVFAATADDLLSEVAELFALHGSGFSWRQLSKRSRILIPIFALATYGAFQVEPLIEGGHVVAAGVVFGLSAVALSLTTALQSIQLYRHAFQALLKEGKMELRRGESVFWYALHQDFINPARLGLFVGAVCSPLLAAAIFFFFPETTKNGWVLAMLGSTESIVAGLTVIAAHRIHRWMFRARMRRALRRLLSPTRRATS